jgi:hypothetical protein
MWPCVIAVNQPFTLAMFTEFNIGWDTVGNIFRELRIECVSGAQYSWTAVR